MASVSLNTVLLEPTDWEKLIADKEWKISGQKEPAQADPQPPPTFSLSLFQDTALARTLSSLGELSSRTIRAVAGYAGNKLDEYGAELELSSLRRKYGRVWSPECRTELLKLHSVALKQNYSASLKVRIIEARIECVSAHLDARVAPAQVYVYKDLLEILSILSSGGYSQKLVQRVWELMLRELRREGGRHIASALVKCDAGDVYLILRYLAICHLSAWKTLPSKNTVSSEQEARRIAKQATFAWDTYDAYVKTCNGFYELIHGLLKESPTLVHTAFDKEHLYMLWLKHIPVSPISSSGDKRCIEFSRIIDDVAFPLACHSKHFNPELSIESDCLALFIGTSPDATMMSDIVHELDSAVKVFASPDSVQHGPPSFARKFSMLNDGMLPHPALPMLLFAAQLFKHSRQATEIALEADSCLIESLRDMCQLGFPRVDWLDAGKWVLPGNRIRSMTVTTCLVIASMAAHPQSYDILASSLISHRATTEWFWKLASYALHAHVDLAAKPWSEALLAIKPFAVHFMKQYNTHPGDGDETQAENVDNLVWILQSTGHPSIDQQLRSFSLDVLIHQVMSPATKWTEAVKILVSCDEAGMVPFKAAMSEFIEHFLKMNLYSSSPMVMNWVSKNESISLQTSKRFLSNPLDRFVMLISQVSRCNRFVSRALDESSVIILVQSLLAGRFDNGSIDMNSAAWRARTCTELLQKMEKEKMKAQQLESKQRSSRNSMDDSHCPDSSAPVP